MPLESCNKHEWKTSAEYVIFKKYHSERCPPRWRNEKLKSIREVIDLAGQIHAMVQSIITQKSKGNAVIANTIKTKIYLKGIAVDKYTPTSPDDFAVIAKIREVAKEFGVTV